MAKSGKGRRTLCAFITGVADACTYLQAGDNHSFLRDRGVASKRLVFVAPIAVKRNGAFALTTRETSFFAFLRNFRRFFRENKDMQTISSALGSTR
jgi:hypothetical protein